MDNVLFYGERDEQTRRQVRSAAAAHSHRIGPRKPKATLRQSASSGSGSGSGSSKDTPPRRRTTQQKHAVGVKQEPAPSTASSPQHVHETREMYRAVPSSVPPSVPPFRDTPMEQPGLAQTNGFPGYAPLIETPRVGPMHINPQHLPLGTPDQQQQQQQQQQQRSRNGAGASPGLGSMSPAEPTSSPADQTQRLPQYSWTEYPRYGLGSNRLQSLEMLADVASSAPTASRSGSPADQGIPGLRHFESSAEGRPILPPLLPTSSPHLPPGGVAETQSRDTAPPPPPPPSRQAAKDPCLVFLQHPRPRFNPSSPG